MHRRRSSRAKPTRPLPSLVRVRRTPRGWRLLQHGTVLSEILASPGATQSVFDVLAAAILLHPAPRDVAMLGFGGGSTLAALRALGSRARVHAVDLDPTGYRLLDGPSGRWRDPLRWAKTDALPWLRGTRHRFDVILEDLSVPADGDVHKPVATWTEFPALVRTHLRPGGLAVFNLLRPRHTRWANGIAQVLAPLGRGVVVTLRDFENRIVVAGLPPGQPARTVGNHLRRHLRSLGSRQADGLCLSSARLASAHRRP